MGLVIDMSHSAERSTLEVIERSSRPIAITHANPTFWHPALRNKSDQVLRSLGESGGILGFSLYPHHLKEGTNCTRKSFCEMVAQTAELMGVNQIGIGSDLCQDQPDEIVEWMRNGRWTKSLDYGEGSAKVPWVSIDARMVSRQPCFWQLGRRLAGGRFYRGGSRRHFRKQLGTVFCRELLYKNGRRHVKPIEQPVLARFYRSHEQVMRLTRMGCSHPTRLSFLRQLLRRLKKENWRFDRPVWQINRQGSVTLFTESRALSAVIAWWPSLMIFQRRCAQIGDCNCLGCHVHSI